MIQLSEEQLHNLNKEALVIIVASLQDQLFSMQGQLDAANAQLADTNRQIELLTEQIRIMNQRHFGKHSEAASGIDGQLSLFDSFNEVEATQDPLAKEPEITEVVTTNVQNPKANVRQILMDFLHVLLITNLLKKSLARSSLMAIKSFRQKSTNVFT